MSYRDFGGYAIVTGAATGIGQETANALAQAGVDGVLFADLNLEGAKIAAKESKALATSPQYQAISCWLDVSDPESVQNMVDLALKHFARIDYSVNSAGITSLKKDMVPDLDILEYDKLHAVLARGTVLMNRAVSKVMINQTERIIAYRNGPKNLGRGVIVNVASAFSLVGAIGRLPYISAKHAVMGIVKASAIELAAHGIRVNGICPTWVTTPMVYNRGANFSGGVQNANFLKVTKALSIRPELASLANANPMRRPAKTEEVADAIVFLCGPGATYITASEMVVDGGLLVASPGSYPQIEVDVNQVVNPELTTADAR